MNLTTSVWLIIAIALLLANLPWISERFLLVIKPASGKKPFWMALVEWLLMFVLLSAIAVGLEKKLFGNTHSQSWEFYVVALCMFMVLAFPGFVYRYQFLKLVNRKA